MQLALIQCFSVRQEPWRHHPRGYNTCEKGINDPGLEIKKQKHHKEKRNAYETPTLENPNHSLTGPIPVISVYNQPFEEVSKTSETSPREGGVGLNPGGR